MTLTCRSITEARAALVRADAHLKRVVARAQKRCTHKQVAECDYHSGHFSAMPPMRVCCACGLAEDGWGPGYVVLKAVHALRITREELYTLREGLYVTDTHKGPLIRHEVTLNQLIDGDK
jgi:hypothetical protein